MKKFRKALFFVYLLIIFSLFTSNLVNADSTLLTPQENLWLESRHNTIVVYPEKNFPPYSYENTAGTPLGLSIDYIELIAEKLGIKIEYLKARPKSELLDDIQHGKGDVATSLADTKERDGYLYFTDTYVTVPAVIVARKDNDSNENIHNLNDLVGKKVAIGDKYAVEEFIRKNNSRIVIESMTDDEASLQQLVLGEVDFAVIDIASLSYYLSRQVLNSVKVVGNTGFEYKLAFGIPKDKQMLQSILDKGLQQISTNDRRIFNDKWIVVPGEKSSNLSAVGQIQDFLGTGTLYILFTIGVAAIVLIIARKRRYPFEYIRKKHGISELKDEIRELEYTSRGLVEELENVKNLEEDIKNKIKEIDN